MDPALPWIGGWSFLSNSSYAGNGTFVVAMREADLPPEPTDWSRAQIFSFPGASCSQAAAPRHPAALSL